MAPVKGEKPALARRLAALLAMAAWWARWSP